MGDEEINGTMLIRHNHEEMSLPFAAADFENRLSVVTINYRRLEWAYLFQYGAFLRPDIWWMTGCKPIPIFHEGRRI